jgi:hypothetical protein
MNKEIDKLEILKIIREIEDEANIAAKALAVFEDSRNWYERYTDENGEISKFRYLNLDPRVIATQGAIAAQKVIDKAKDLFYNIYEMRK